VGNEKIGKGKKGPMKNTSGITTSKCERCGENLRIRITSWFTNETIGLKCMAEEDALKNTMSLLKMNPDEHKGCGREQYEKIKQIVSQVA